MFDNNEMIRQLKERGLAKADKKSPDKVTLLSEDIVRDIERKYEETKFCGVFITIETDHHRVEEVLTGSEFEEAKALIVLG